MQGEEQNAPAPSPGSLIQTRGYLLVLVLVTLVGGLLRLRHIGYESLWMDEAITFGQASQPFGAMLQQSKDDTHPPLFNLLLHGWLKLSGHTEGPMRTLSALFGTLTIPLIYRSGALLAGARAGLFAAAAVAVALFQIRYSQELRTYSLFSFLAALDLCFLIQLLKWGRRRDKIGYAVTTLLLLFTHPFAPFVVLSQNLVVIGALSLERHRFQIGLKAWFLIQIVISLAFSPWLVILAGKMSRHQKGFWLAPPDLSRVYWTFSLYAGSDVLLLLSVPLVILSVSRSQRRVGSWLEGRGGVWLLMAWLLTPIVVPVVLSLISQPLYHPRYTIAGSVAWYLLLALGWSRLGRWPRLQIVVAIVLLTLSVWNVRQSLFKFPRKAPWREIVSHIEAKAKPNDRIMVYPPRMLASISFYQQRPDLRWDFFPQLSSEQRRELPKVEQIQRARMTVVAARELRRLAKDEPRVWVLLAFRDQEPHLVRDALAEHQQTGEWMYKLTDVLRFELSEEAPSPPIESDL